VDNEPLHIKNAMNITGIP